MIWIIYALFCAFFAATSAALSKMAMQRTDEYVVGWIRLLFSLPFLFVLMLSGPITKLDSVFWIVVCVLLPLDTIGLLLYLKAIKSYDLSIVMPLLGFTPAFAILTAFLFLHEKPSLLGVIGITSVIWGAYLLNIHTANKGILEPIKEVFRNRGSKFMIIVAIIYSASSALGKVALLHSSPTSVPFIYFSILFLAMSPILMFRLKKGFSKIDFSKKQMLLYLGMGIAFSLAIFTHFQAILRTEVSYMISVKRLSLVFGVMYGAMLFKEKNIKNRLIGAIFMFLGAVLIAFA